MTRYFYFLTAVLVITACKETHNNKDDAPAAEEMNILQKVAYAHGIQHWDKVEEIQFTFNVDRDSTHFQRTWIWNPNRKEVTSITEADTLTYIRSEELDTAFVETDKGFINDKYWLLAPFQLLWDKGFDYTLYQNEKAPISGKTLQKLTIVYPDWGGYTPGDAYDFFLTDDYRIAEWIFRKGNAPEPSLVTTWEDYDTINGLVIAKGHRRDEGVWTLYFTDISVSPK